MDESLSFRLPLTPGPGAWLVLDAAWPQAAVGVWNEGRWLSFVSHPGPTVEIFFALAERALADAGVKLSELAGYIFCEGPGSVLGLRTAAMALRAWTTAPGVVKKPVLACNSLALACALAKLSRGSDATVFAASRRDRWNAFASDAMNWVECDAVALTALPGPYLRLPARDLGTPPVDAETFDPVTVLGRHPEVFLKSAPLYPTDAPDAANIANAYVTWSGERHKG